MRHSGVEHGGGADASKLAEMEAALHHAFLLRLPPNLPEKSETQNLVESNAYSRITAKLCDALFHDIAAKYSDITVDQLKCRIQRRLQEHFPSLHTPTHPTYAMRAIQELGEEEGSREEAISDFIKREYEDLPLAHAAFLQRYLGKLCESGELASSNGRYKVTVRDEKVLKRKTKRGRGRRRVKRKRQRAMVDVGDFDREKQPSDGIEELEGEQGRGLAAEGKEMATKEENARNVEQCLSEKMERALDEGSRLQEKEEFKDENPQQPPLKLRSRGRPPKPKSNPDLHSKLQIKRTGRGRPRKTNQAAIPTSETLSASNLEQNLQSRETDAATLLQSKRPRRERRPPKWSEVIQ